MGSVFGAEDMSAVYGYIGGARGGLATRERIYFDKCHTSIIRVVCRKAALCVRLVHACWSHYNSEGYRRNVFRTRRRDGRKCFPGARTFEWCVCVCVCHRLHLNNSDH